MKNATAEPKTPVAPSTQGQGVSFAMHDPHQSRQEDPHRQEFVQSLTRAQVVLRRYITGLVGDPDTAGNILQETNLRLLQKADEFERGTNFDAWATRFAYWQVRAHVRDRGRDKHVFSEELISQLSAHNGAQAEHLETLVTALRGCLTRLRQSDRELVSMRHGKGYSIQDLSGRLGKSPSAVKGMLLRARRSLKRCIELKTRSRHSD